MELYQEMSSRGLQADIVTFTSLVGNHLTQEGHLSKRARGLLQEMRDKRVKPNLPFCNAVFWPLAKGGQEEREVGLRLLKEACAHSIPLGDQLMHLYRL